MPLGHLKLWAVLKHYDNIDPYICYVLSDVTFHWKAALHGSLVCLDGKNHFWVIGHSLLRKSVVCLFSKTCFFSLCNSPSCSRTHFCRPGWPLTQRDLPGSASWVGIKGMSHHHSWLVVFSQCSLSWPGTCYVEQAVLKPICVHLSLPPECWNWRHVSWPRPAK